MDKTIQAFEWKTVLSKTYHDFVQQFVDYIPQILGAVLLLLLGWGVAILLRLLTRKLMRGVDNIIRRASPESVLPQPTQRSFSRFAENIVFWSVVVFFVVACGNLLEWQIFSSLTNAVLTFLPNVVTGLLIILVGIGLSSVTRSAVQSACESSDIGYAVGLGRVAQISVVLTATVIGVEQLGVKIDFLSTSLIVAAGVLMGGVALAFGLGARDFIANIIGAQTISKYYRPGQRVRIAKIEGHILEITPVSILIDTSTGRAKVPAKIALQVISEVIEFPDGVEEGIDAKSNASGEPSNDTK